MMKSILLLTLFPLLAFYQQSPTIAYTEEQKIAYLISAIGRLDAVFIIDNKAQTPKETMNYLANERKKRGNQIKTAKQFIAVVGSKSAQTGKPYTIKYHNGPIESSAVFFTTKLQHLELAQ